jgi:hypothetical protein
MIRIMHLDQRWADVEVLDGKLRVVVYDGDEASVWRLLNSPALRHDEAGNLLTDKQVYDSLPYRMQGFLWAVGGLADHP